MGAASWDTKEAGAIPVWAGAGVPNGSKKHSIHKRGATISVFAKFVFAGCSVHLCDFNFIDSLCAKK
jgi:hypothetical protein